MVENQITIWIKKNRLILLIVLLALFLRLFRISSYMTFLGDEGRDALVWLRMLHGKFTLIGPQTSIGNMYLGPLYYYLMLPFYIILGTIGPSVGVALFAGITTFLLWKFGREWFSDRVGLVASFLYAISPVAIVLSRSSWNPNVMPFFSLLTIWGIWQFWQKERYLWLTVGGVSISFAVQSHYLGLLLILIASLFWIVTLLRLIRDKDKKLNAFLFHSIFGVLFFVLLTIAPLVWFDLRHDFINYKAFYNFFSERQTTVNLKPYKAIPEIWPLWKMVMTRLLAGRNEIFGFWLSLLLGSISLIVCIPAPILGSLRSDKRRKKETVLIFIWLLVGLGGMGLYKQHIYDHYFGFLFPAVFLIASLILTNLWELRSGGKIFAGALFFLIIFFGVVESPFGYRPNYQMKRTEEICRKIIEESGGKPFNLGMIAKQNYDAGYRYFLEMRNRKPLEINPQKLSETKASQLFVVCEEKECQPVSHPQAEIANFGWSKIEREWMFPWGTKLFKLVPYK